jgi:hypothetical protein
MKIINTVLVGLLYLILEQERPPLPSMWKLKKRQEGFAMLTTPSTILAVYPERLNMKAIEVAFAVYRNPNHTIPWYHSFRSQSKLPKERYSYYKRAFAAATKENLIVPVALSVYYGLPQEYVPSAYFKSLMEDCHV